MNKWNDIVLTLRELKDNGADEEEYQKRIEEQFKFLGWSIAGGCVESKPVLPEGNAKSLIPDIVLKKDGERVLAVEVKEPNNRLKPRQETQLFSYMRQLELRVGLYIGEKWQLYYNAPDDKEDPHPVLTAALVSDIEAGSKFCELLTHEDFSLQSLESFCSEQLRRQRYRKQLHERLVLLNEDGKGVALLKELLRDKLMAEDAIDDILEDELAQVRLNYEFGKAMKNKSAQSAKSKAPAEKKKLSKYSLNGGSPMFMTKIALEALRQYVKRYPNATFAEIEERFPKSLTGGRAMVRRYSELRELLEAGSKEMNRYSAAPSEILKSADNVEFVVCTQWHAGNFPKLIKTLNELKWKVRRV